MNNAKHTPGPWTHYADLPSTDPNWHIITTANKMRVLANVHIEPGNPMDEANARLISAAPDLLEALRWFIDDIDGTHTKMVDFDANVNRARAAIAKAEGRS